MAQYSRVKLVIMMKESAMVPLFYRPEIELEKDYKASYKGSARADGINGLCEICP